MKASRGGLKCLCYKFVWLKGFKGKKLLSSKGLLGYMALFEAPPFIIPLPKVVEGINFEDEYKEPEGQIHDYIRNFRFHISPTTFFQDNKIDHEGK
jgi:hypothetical protein